MPKTQAPTKEEPRLTAAEVAELSAQVAEIERRLARVKEQLKAAEPKRYKTLGELFGVIAGTPDIPYEVFEEGKYHFTWEGEEIR